MGNYFMTRYRALQTNNTLGEVTNIHKHISLQHYDANEVGFEPLNTGSLVDCATTNALQIPFNLL
jgi:hypothetical protein